MIGKLLLTLINLWFACHNLMRRLFGRRVDYVYLEISGSLPEFAEAPPLLQRILGVSPPASLAQLRRQLQRIANDPRTQGVLLRVSDFTPGWSTAESLRDELRAFRARGKRVIVYLPGADTRTYFALCAADEVLMPSTSYLYLLGILAEMVFLRDALRTVGVEAEVTAVSPYKTAGEALVRSDISPENREQTERLLDQRYESLVHAIATDRKLPLEQVRALIDAAPYIGRAALTAGLIDGVCYEDELETRLNEHLQTNQKRKKKPHRVSIAPWREARKLLPIPYRRAQKRRVAVVSVQGAIMMGENRMLPVPLPGFGALQAGSETIIRALRQVEKDDQIAALVLHVDSPGGDSFASDLIWREVLRVRQHKPVVVSMGNVAASGGYYVAACASAIIAQPGTITGSIGVVTLRPVATKLLDRIGVNATALSRGARAGLLASAQAPTDDERAVFRQLVAESYDAFKQRVCSGRNLSAEYLEAIAGGRVWTGREAQQHGLVDELGGLPCAVAKARALANLPADPSTAVQWVRPGKRRDLALPRAFPTTPDQHLAALITPLQDMLRPRILAMMPWGVREH